MRTLKKLLIALIVLLFSFGTASALVLVEKAAPSQALSSDLPVFEAKVGGINPRTLGLLGLTPDQRAQLYAHFQQDRQAEGVDTARYRKKIEALVLANKIDKKAAHSLIEERQKMRMMHHMSSLARQMQLVAVLTAEQKIQYAILLKRHNIKPTQPLAMAN